MPPAGSDRSETDPKNQHADRSERRPEQSGSDNSGNESDSRAEQTDDRQSSTQTDEREGVRVEQQRSFLFDCLRDTEQAKQRLPYILRLLDTDEKPIRVLAATTCCLVAVETDDKQLIEYLVRRLSDRLSEDEISLELTTALDYLSSEYSEYVDQLLAEIAKEQDEDVPLPEVGNFTRNYYYGYDPSREGTGRMRIAGQNTDENLRMTVSDTQQEEREQTEHEREREPSETTEDEEETRGGFGDADQTSEASAVAVQSTFDELHLQGERRSGRYSTIYEALVERGGERQAVALRLITRPEDVSVIGVFDDEISDYLRRWQAVSDHDHIVTILDWGREPQPWIATPLAGESLADREHTDFETAIGNALDIVDALSTAHQHDVVHAGLDATNVVFPSDSFGDVAQQAPLLDNVGLLQCVRHYFNPGDRLDPRYAAPEYYSERFGKVDHATDIYQLGTVMYKLFTGRPPHTGSFDAIRDSVLQSTPPPPSAIGHEVPEAIDDLLSKAMAKQKIRRYETVEHLHQELASIAENYGYV